MNPAAQVVYVDNERVSVASSELLSGQVSGVAAVEADFTRPAEVCEHATTRAALDFDRSIAVVLSCALHLVPDEQDPAGIVAGYRQALAPRSFLAISHGTSDNRPDFDVVSGLYKQASNPFVPRGYAEIASWFEGCDLLDPGLVFTALWRPEEDDEPVDHDVALRSGCYAGVGRTR